MRVVQRLLRLAVAFLIVFGSAVSILGEISLATAASDNSFQAQPCDLCVDCERACVVPAACANACAPFGLPETDAQASFVAVDHPTPTSALHVSSVGQQIPTPPPRLSQIV